MSQLKVLFYVQHLLGVGHVYRATRIAQSLASAGEDVHLVWGGTRVPGFNFEGLTVHHLPPVRSGDASFSNLLHANGEVFTEDDKSNRRDLLLSIFKEISPHIVMIEAFPFGRRQMRFELLPLLQLAKSNDHPPMVVASIRDIMQENRKQSRVQESIDLVENWFDLILVHGDERFIEIGETLQGTNAFQGKIRYTGLVTPEPEFREPKPEFKADVLVSVGGGAFGQELAEIAIEASRLPSVSSLDWLVATGSEMSEADVEKLRENSKNSARLVRFIPDLMSAMRECSVSVSHAGYNTVADLLRSQTKAVLYPHTGGRETEQLRRAQMLQDRGLAKMIAPDELSPESLAASVVEAKNMHPGEISLDLEGASNSAEILRKEYSMLGR